MVDTKINAPAIRFDGFTDEWEQRTLGEEFERVNERNDGSFGITHWISVAKMYFQDPSKVTSNNLDTRTYVMRTGDIAFEGHPNTEFQFGRFVANDIGDGIISELFPIYRHRTEYYNSYWKYAIQIEQIMRPIYAKAITSSGASSNKLNEEHFLRESILVPSYAEQVKIGDIFKRLDNLIVLHQQKHDRLVEVKESCLKKLFTKPGEDVPEIRIKGFTGNWKKRKLLDVFISYSDPVEIPHTGYERLGIRSHAKGTFHNYVSAGQELQTAQMNRVAANKFIVNITFGWEHAVAVTDENDAGKLVSHRFPQFSLSDELDPKFLKYLIIDERFRHHLWLASPGGAGRNRVLNINEMLQYEIQIPTIIEQRKIAATLINLDSLIALHQRKCEKLKAVKKSLLQKMFV